MIPTDSYVTNYVYWLGIDGYEPGGPGWWASLVASHHGVVELGTNVGLYTVIGALADPTTPYIAVEPNPISCHALRRNLDLNRLAHVRVIEAAVVGMQNVSNVSLHFPDRDPYRASAGAFVDSGPQLITPSKRSITVRTISAIDLVDGTDLMKLDIEGLEADVLQAVQKWLVQRRPTLLVEVLDSAKDLHRFLADLVARVDYVCVALENGRPTCTPVELIAQGRLQQVLGTRDATLIHRDRLAALGLGSTDL